MTEPPFTIALRLNVHVLGDTPVSLKDLTALPAAAERELLSKSFPRDQRPDKVEANRVLAESFADQSLVNTNRDPLNPPIQLTAGTAYVVARVVTLPGLAPIPPGGEYPTVGDEFVSDDFLVHRAPLHDDPRWTDDEATAAHMLLKTIVESLPRELWDPDA